MDRSIPAVRLWPARAVMVCGFLTAALGTLVLVGWHAGNLSLVQLFGDGVVMHYLTALGLLVGGAGLGLAGWPGGRGRRVPVMVAGVAIVLVFLLVLLEYVFDRNLGVYALRDMWPQVNGFQQARPAPPTAVALTLCGSALFLLGSGVRREWCRLAVWLLGSLASALSGMVICGYLAGLPELYVWGNYVGIAPHTAAGIYVLSAGLLLAQMRTRRLINDRWLPVPVALATVTAALLLWHALQVERERSIRSATEVALSDLVVDARLRMESSLRFLEEMKRRWETRGGTPVEEWRSDALAFLKEENFFASLQWVDASWVVQWVEPAALSLKTVGRSLTESSRQMPREQLEFSASRNHPITSAVKPQMQGGRGYEVYLPLWTGGRFDGFFLGEFEVHRFALQLVNEPVFAPFSVRIFLGDELVYKPAPGRTFGGVSRTTVDLFGHDWTFQIQPRVDTFHTGHLPDIILGLGLLLALAATLAVRGYQVAIWGAGATAAANRQLKSEIGEREEMERLLRDSEKHLHLVLDSAIGVAVITSDDKGCINYFSKGAERLLGYEAAEVVGRSTPALFHDVAEVDRRAKELSAELGEKIEGFETFVAVPKREGYERREWTYLCKDGSRRTVDLTVTGQRAGGGSAVSGFVGTAVDITERKEMEGELRRLLREKVTAQALLQAASRIVRLGHWYLPLDGSGPHWSEMTYAIHEVSPEVTLTLEEAISFYQPEERAEIDRKVQEAIRSGTTFDFEALLTTAKGRKVWIHARGEPVYDEEGHIIALRGVIQDIDERRKAAELLECRNRELEAATARAEAHARAKAEFLANMSHEIRTPLNAVIGLSELLMDERLDGRAREFVETIHNSGDLLLSLINDILDFSKIESGQLELEHIPVRLRDCIESALDLVAEPASRKHLDLMYWIDRDVPSALLGDPTRLRQVMVNLLSNAIKFTDKGEVFLKVSRVDPVGEGGEGASLLRVVVRDTGVGIPAAKMDRLFHAFSQVDSSTTRRYGGTGLGLAISHRLVESMHGRIWVESEVGLGSSFIFEIPLEAVEIPMPAALGTNSIRSLQGLRVLIVDDNATNRTILQMQMEAWSMKPITVANSAAALELIERGEPLDLAILDVNMPGGDGYDLAARIRRMRSERALPIVVLSSVSDHPADLKKLGIAGVLTKPVKITPLFNALRNVLSGGHRDMRHETHVGKLADICPLDILVADDNVVNQRVTGLLLQRLGYKPVMVSNGVEVLREIERRSFDVVLLDVQMPDLDGFEAARILCARMAPAERPWLIALTAHAVEGDRDDCLAAGMDDYLSKPLRTENLQSALRNAYAQKHQAVASEVG